MSYSSATYTLTVSQTNGSLSRSVKYVKNAASDLTSIVDANGKTTAFTYGANGLASITGPTGGVTSFTYTYDGLVASVSQTNTTTGSPGTSVTRLTYPAAGQTFVADPATSQSVSVAASPHTTYTFNTSSYLVSKAVDSMGRQRAATYTTNADVATFTSGTGTTSGTSTSTYGANNGESQTAQRSPGGATSSAAYGNTAAATKYLPSSTTNDAGNSSTYTYNGAGNQMTSSNAMAATATLTRNTDGTISSAVAPGNGSNKTTYTYNTDKQLTSVTPVTGAGLGVRTFTYDGFGRTRTETNGAGITVTYSYDKQDRLLSTAFSDTTPTVTNTYTDAGQIRTRTDANGVTTYGYDQLGRLISRVNTFAGGTISYAYDKASNLVSTTDTRGTTTNTFDSSGVPTKITYAKGAGTAVLGIETDDQGRRTDTYLQSNGTNSAWAAHTHQDYDSSGRVSRVIAETMNTSGVITTTMDVSYCYNSATVAPNCSTGTSTDRAKLQWSKDNLTGQTTTYTYNGAGYVTKVAQAGGTGANTWSYTYDSRGNRLTASVTGATPSTQSFTVNAANQITSTGFGFDGAGNMTSDADGTYVYNGADQMTTSTRGTSSYAYKYAGASQNEVLQQETPASTYQLVYGRTNGVGNPVVEQVKVGANTAYVENDPVTGQPLMLRTSSGIQALYVYAGTGSPVALLTDFASQAYAYSYDPYGVAVLTQSSGGNGEVQNPFLFQGGIKDRATGWVHFGARWYNPSTGRWTQQDTLDAPLDPANANRYAYAGNDPVNNMDPTGRFNASCLLGAAAGLAFTAISIAELTGSELAAGTLAAPTGGASLAAGVIVGVGFAADIAVGVSLTAYSLSRC